MKILITGSNGQLGRELNKQLSQQHDLLLVDIKELDISNLAEVNDYFEKNKIDLVINTAAYTNVDKCEEEYNSAQNVNAIGPRNLAMVANKFNIAIIHISTDYVFEGLGNKDSNGGRRAYYEFDLPNPQSIYGRTKLLGEKYVITHNPKHFILRTAWLYGDGNNFVKTMLNLAREHQQLKVVDDQVGTPTSTYELAKAIGVLLTSEEYGIYHATCEGQCSWYHFAKKIFEHKNINIDVQPCKTEEFPRPAKRPEYSVLENSMFKTRFNYQFNEWEDALIKYLKEND